MRTKQIIDHHYHLCTESKRERESKRDEKGDVICNSGIDYCYLSLFMLGMNFTFLIQDAYIYTLDLLMSSKPC